MGRWLTSLFVSLVVASLAVTLALVATIAIPQAASAFGYKDTGLDPDDRPIDKTSCCQQDPDIRSTTRKVWVDRRGHAWLTVYVRMYDQRRGYWIVVVRLDARGGPASDHRMRLYDSDAGFAACWFRPTASHDPRRGVLLGVGEVSDEPLRVGCRVPLRWLDATKHIRWKLFSPHGSEGSGGARVDEYAPNNRGWYPREVGG